MRSFLVCCKLETMEQHLFPQHISSYEFRLIGGLYRPICPRGRRSNCGAYFPTPPLTRLYQVVPCFSSAALERLCFFPLRAAHPGFGFSFLRSIYSPTQYVWRKSVASFDFQTRTPSTEEPFLLPQPQKPSLPKSWLFCTLLVRKMPIFIVKRKLKKLRHFWLFISNLQK